MLWQLLALQAIFFLALIFALRKLFHGQLLGAIASMEKVRESNVKKERELKRSEESVLKDCRDRIRQADAEIRDKKIQLEKELKAMHEGARKRTQDDLQAAEERLKQKEKALEGRFQREAGRQGRLMACDLVKQAFGEKMLAALHRVLVEELLESLGTHDTRHTTHDAGRVVVKTAYALTAQEKEALRKGLAVRFGGKAAAFEEKVDHELVAGFSISVGEIVLDGTLRNKFERFQSEE